MVQPQEQDDFDWVAAQAKCSAALMFTRLRSGVGHDVSRRNELGNGDDDWFFELVQDDEGFEVSRLLRGVVNQRVDAVVRFEQAGRRIHVRGDGVDVDFTAVVSLDPTTGTCRFVVGEGMYADWEIRRLALEQLFFEEAEAQ